MRGFPEKRQYYHENCCSDSDRSIISKFECMRITWRVKIQIPGLHPYTFSFSGAVVVGRWLGERPPNMVLGDAAGPGQHLENVWNRWIDYPTDYSAPTDIPPPLVHQHPTPVLLPGKSHGRRSLVGCIPWGR